MADHKDTRPFLALNSVVLDREPPKFGSAGATPLGGLDVTDP